jgi:hypothetical protein
MSQQLPGRAGLGLLLAPRDRPAEYGPGAARVAHTAHRDRPEIAEGSGKASSIGGVLARKRSGSRRPASGKPVEVGPVKCRRQVIAAGQILLVAPDRFQEPGRRSVEPGATATTVPVLLTVATAALPVRRIAGVRR